VIEPGPIGSRSALQDFESTAFVGRQRFVLESGSLGMLATGRFNDDGSANVVVGADGTWTPTAADQINAQFLRSQTRNPNRRDLLDAWTGQRFAGSAYALGWTHSADAGFSSIEYQSFSRDFRAWNGFVTQVGVSSLTGVGSLYFYPDNDGLVTRFGPQLTISRVESNAGEQLSQTISPGLSFRAARDTVVALAWQPNSVGTTFAGRRSYDSWTLGISSTPVPWMPQTTLSVSAGDALDTVTGMTGDGINLLAMIPLRFSRLEVGSIIGYQTLRSRASADDGKTLFVERDLQVTGTWHFSSRLNLRLTHQQTTFDARPPFAGLAAGTHAHTRLSSVLLSYQTNWQTRMYFGVMTSSDRADMPEPLQTKALQVFAKISYAFSN
jgi:hypothetical protein